MLKNFCLAKSITFDEARYDNIVSDIINGNLKPIQQEIQACCSDSSKIPAFKRNLAKHILFGSLVYFELCDIIFDK